MNLGNIRAGTLLKSALVVPPLLFAVAIIHDSGQSSPVRQETRSLPSVQERVPVASGFTLSLQGLSAAVTFDPALSGEAIVAYRLPAGKKREEVFRTSSTPEQLTLSSADHRVHGAKIEITLPARFEQFNLEAQAADASVEGQAELGSGHVRVQAANLEADLDRLAVTKEFTVQVQAGSANLEAEMAPDLRPSLSFMAKTGKLRARLHGVSGLNVKADSRLGQAQIRFHGESEEARWEVHGHDERTVGDGSIPVMIESELGEVNLRAD